MARVDEARALARIAFADRLPAAGFGGDAARGRSTKDGMPQGESRIYESFDAFGLASFELDIWGKYRRLDEAARAELLATAAGRDAVQLSLTADVAALYFYLRTLEAQTRIARDQLATYDKTCEIYRKRYRWGYTQELDLRRIEADRLATEALLYQRENEQSKAETALAMLLGRSPRDIVQGFSEQGKTLEELTVFPRTPENIPSDLLARRPDICRDEHMLIAANARIGAARAAFFPSIMLTGQYGSASSELQDLFTGGATIWHIAAGLTQPIFEGGKLFAREKAARARQEQMLAHYEQTVQNAFRETRDALVAGTKTSQVLAASIERVRAMHRSCELSQKQHARGYISIIDVLDIQRRSLQAEFELSAARQGQLDSIIALCRAMGGGWQENPDEARLY
jgi:multidrug efflux system outer membrane protein